MKRWVKGTHKGRLFTTNHLEKMYQNKSHSLYPICCDCTCESLLNNTLGVKKQKTKQWKSTAGMSVGGESLTGLSPGTLFPW